MTDKPWTPGTATAIGSMPGTDPVETARVLAGELPGLTPIPELPARGVGADMLGRTAGLLRDLPVELVPSGYRVAARAGRDQRRAIDLLRWDVDALQQATEHDTTPRSVKLQAAGPWSLAAGIELARGHRVLTDHGALRDFTESLVEGLLAHAHDVTARTGARVVLQLDEPTLPVVLGGKLPTPSGYGTVPAVPEPEALSLLTDVIGRLSEATGSPVIVHCCASRPPVRLLHGAGAGALALDATGLDTITSASADELGEAWEDGVTLLLGLVPATAPAIEPSPRELVRPALDLAARLGFPRGVLAELGMPTPACGLAGATPKWASRALTLSAEIGRILHEESEE